MEKECNFLKKKYKKTNKTNTEEHVIRKSGYEMKNMSFFVLGFCFNNFTIQNVTRLTKILLFIHERLCIRAALNMLCFFSFLVIPGLL